MSEWVMAAQAPRRTFRDCAMEREGVEEEREEDS